jgi:hypothetical protein
MWHTSYVDVGDLMNQLHTLSPEALFAETASTSGENVVEFVGSLESFALVFNAAGNPLLFHRAVLLSEEDFSLGEEENGHWVFHSLFELPTMQPFHARLGEPYRLWVFFLHESYRIELKVDAAWWPEFEAALEVAGEDRLNREDAAADARVMVFKTAAAERLTVLERELPNDVAFIALACEPRPRVTALRERAGEVLKKHLGSGMFIGSEDPRMREIAAELREKHRRSARSKSRE